MITITVILLAIMALAVGACFLPLVALPLLDIVVCGLLIWYFVKLIKKLFKKKD